VKDGDLIIDDFLKPLQELAREIAKAGKQNMHVKGLKMPKNSS
jgi:hypothetical protein